MMTNAYEYDEFDRYWDYLTEGEIATDAELCLVSALMGRNVKTLQSVLYVRTGYRSIEQIEEEFCDED